MTDAFPFDSPRIAHSPRDLLEDLVEALIAMLDAADGDTELQDGDDDEPSICAYGPGHDLELDTADDEPSLGSHEVAKLYDEGGSLIDWHYGFDQTMTWQHEGAVDAEAGGGDQEPSLGWTSSINQDRRRHDACDDREGEHDGREPDCNAVLPETTKTSRLTPAPAADFSVGRIANELEFTAAEKGVTVEILSE